MLSMRFRNSKGMADITTDLGNLELLLSKSPAVRAMLEEWAKSLVEPALKDEASNIALTGKLASRVRARIQGSRRGYRLDVGAPYVKYAMMQERGGTIVPKHAPLLTVPIYDGKKSLTPRKRPSDYSNTFTLPSKSVPGEKTMYQRQGRGRNARAIPIFALKKLVNIPPQYWITKAMEKSYPQLTALLRGAKLI